ncbi:MAG TPA: metallopeptidase TldD-related protein, partial [Thermomicrobiaceae bacterium]|nr:metallopeptidase TldD-related protein [Thermomicrobiaceae bacterium]
DRHPGLPDEAAVARLAARLRERHRDVSSTISVVETRETRRIKTTEGADAHDGRSFVMVRVTVSRADQGEALDLTFEAPWIVAGTTLDVAFARLDDRLRWTGRAATAGNHDLPVVLTPRALAALVVEPLGEALSGPALVEGTSFLLDYAPADPAGMGLTLLDDPALAGAPRSRRVDDEGVPPVRRELLRDGAVVGRALDLGSGERLGAPSTGSAWRAWDAWPSAAPSTLVVPEGGVPLGDLLAHWPRAILVDDVSGEWFTDAGASGVTASASLAFLVEGGEVVGRLRDIALSADREGLIRGDLTVSREVEWVGDRAVLPYAHAAGLSVVDADG